MRHENIQTTNYFPFKVFLFKSTNADRLISTHWHESTELIYCIKGNLNARVLEKTYTLKDGDFLMINSNVPHTTWSPVESKVLVLQFPLSLMKELTLTQYGKSNRIDINPLLRDSSLTSYNTITHLLYEIYSFYEKGQEKYYWEIMGWLHELFGIFTRNYMIEVKESEQFAQSSYLNQLKEIESFIQKNYSENLQLKNISSEFGFNTSYFSRFFKKHMGVNYSTYLKTIRLEKAYELLSTTDLSIVEIALRVGFNTSKAFTNAFKDQFGLPPNQYRLRNFN